MTTKVISVVVLKGGAGKTTISLNLGKTLYKAGWDVSLLDADLGQGSLMVWANLAPEDSPTVTQPVLSKLRRDLQRSSAQITIIDGPPRADGDVRRILKASDIVLMPVVPGLFDLAALRESLDVLQEVQDDRAESGEAPLITRAVINRSKLRSKLTQEAKEALEEAGVEFMPTMVGDRAVFGKATAEGLAAIDIEPTGPASREIQQLAMGVLELLQLETVGEK